MIKKKYIVSGTYEEYNEFVYKRRNENNTSYVYVQHATQLTGLSNIEGFYIGTYFKRPDIDDIRERIAIAKRIMANDIEINQLAERIKAEKEISYTNEYSVENYFDIGNNRYVAKKEYKPAEDSVYGNVTGYIVEPVKQLDNNHVVDYRVNRLFSG
jgi:ribosomal protein L7Ae-like RNA K-turn-binding protein